MRILVTGHKGFVGRYFYKELCYRGYDVKGIDIVDGVSCDKFFQEDTEVFDYVFHFACYVEPKREVKNIKTSNISYDIYLDSLLFSWALRTLQKNIIYFSSSSVYPIELQDDKDYRLKESDVDSDFNIIRKPDNIYGWAKLNGEFFLKYMREHGVNSFVFRPFSIYGEDQSSNFIFKVFLDSISRKDDVLNVWGDGNQIRDFIYIKDVVDSVMTIVEMGYETPINIGTGVPTSLNDMLEMMLQEANWRPSAIVHLLEKNIGEKYRCADVSLLNRIYKPKHSIRSVVREYFKRNSK